MSPHLFEQIPQIPFFTPPVSPTNQTPCALPKMEDCNSIISQPLAHSSQNNPGYTLPHPISELNSFCMGWAGSKPRDLGSDRGYRVVVVMGWVKSALSTAGGLTSCGHGAQRRCARTRDCMRRRDAPDTGRDFGALGGRRVILWVGCRRFVRWCGRSRGVCRTSRSRGPS
jgi:hypothetical protein